MLRPRDPFEELVDEAVIALAEEQRDRERADLAHATGLMVREALVDIYVALGALERTGR